ncbi:MAG: hypothetical protein E7457_01390 [Ruminococcaceae bacterium]|nr:hypothetical protein [Oscillospiraceae bacterium]
MATFYNSATLSYNGTITNSNVVSGELVEALAVTKTATRDEYALDENIVYVISMVNTSGASISGLTITDDLGAYTFGAGTTTLTPMDYVPDSVLYYADGVLQAAPSVVAGPPLEISGITVPANGSAVVVYEATPNQYAPRGLEGTIVNTATVAGEDLTNPVTATETVASATGPNLTISKALSPATVTENGQLTYTFTIQNYGNAPADTEDSVALQDTFNPILEGLTVTFNGAVWTEPGQYTYADTTGVFATVPGQITVPSATYAQDPVTGAWSVVPGVSTLVVTGTV